MCWGTGASWCSCLVCGWRRGSRRWRCILLPSPDGRSLGRHQRRDGPRIPSSYPHVRVFTQIPPFFLTVGLLVWTMLLYWLALQFLGGLGGLSAEDGGGVAFW